jgi:hypothetical protein
VFYLIWQLIFLSNFQQTFNKISQSLNCGDFILFAIISNNCPYLGYTIGTQEGSLVSASYYSRRQMFPAYCTKAKSTLICSRFTQSSSVRGTQAQQSDGCLLKSVGMNVAHLFVLCTFAPIPLVKYNERFEKLSPAYASLRTYTFTRHKKEKKIQLHSKPGKL